MTLMLQRDVPHLVLALPQQSIRARRRVTPLLLLDGSARLPAVDGSQLPTSASPTSILKPLFAIALG